MPCSNVLDSILSQEVALQMQRLLTAVHRYSSTQSLWITGDHVYYLLRFKLCDMFVPEITGDLHILYHSSVWGGWGLNICPSLPFDVVMTSPLRMPRSRGLHALSAAGGVRLCKVGDIWRSLYSTAFAMQNILSAELALPCYQSVVVELMRNFLICLSHRIIKRRRGGEEGGRALDRFGD